jgi:hypothetical protein
MIYLNIWSSSILFFFLIHRSENEMLYEAIKVCSDSNRIDFTNSCKGRIDDSCTEDLEYIKNFQDYTDYYFTRKNEVYHAIDDAVYSTNCELTNQVSNLFITFTNFPFLN